MQYMHNCSCITKHAFTWCVIMYCFDWTCRHWFFKDVMYTEKWNISLQKLFIDHYSQCNYKTCIRPLRGNTSPIPSMVISMSSRLALEPSSFFTVVHRYLISSPTVWSMFYYPCVIKGIMTMTKLFASPSVTHIITYCVVYGLLSWNWS